MTEIALALAWLAIAWLALTLAATRRQLASVTARPEPRPAAVEPHDADGLIGPAVAVVVQPDCSACATLLDELRREEELGGGRITVITASGDLAASEPGILLAPHLTAALRPPAFPWVAGLDHRLRVAEFEPFSSVARLRQIGEALADASPKGA